MTYVEDANEYVLVCSGRRFAANLGILGIGDNADHINGGYDNSIRLEFSPAEKAEIAEEMIKRWAAWAKLWSRL